jgi:hypothetical protein
MADNDQARILVGGTATNAGYLEIATADDGTEPIYVRQYTGVFSSLTRTLTLLDGSGNSNFPGHIQTNANGIKWDESGVRSWNMFPTSGYLAITSGDGAGYFSSTMTGGIRSPIFYDNNDTTYYADPASTSWGFYSAGGGRFRNIQISDSTYTDTIQHVTSGSNLWLQYGHNGPVGLCYGGGNVGVGTLASAAAKLHVRVSAPTSIGTLPSGVTMLSDSNTNNYLLFRNTADNGTYGGIAFQDNNIGGYVIFGNAGGAGDLLYVAGYGGGQLQHGTSDSINPAARTTVASWNSTGLQVNSGDFRASIFYDISNTGYYYDPLSTSKQYQAIIFGDSSRYSAVSTTINGTGAGDKLILYGETSNYDARVLVGTDYDFIFKSQGSLTDKGNFKFYSGTGALLALTIDTDQSTISSTAMRSPIYYDSADSGYYLNPNSTSNLGGMTLACNVATGRSSYGRTNANLVLLADSTYGAACIDFRSGVNYPSDGAQIYYETATNGVSGETSRLVIRTENDADDSILIRGGFIQYQATTVDGGPTNPGHRFLYSGTDRMFVYSDNTTEFGSFRAPLFYDSNNTAYYTDPASNSVLNTINGRGISNLMYYQGFTLDANTMDSNATGFTYAVNAPTVGPVVRFSTGGGYDLWLNAAYSGAGTNLFFRTRNGDAGTINSWRTIPSYGVNANIDSLFATIYYDGSNTGYYADFASTAADCAIFAGGIHVSKGNVSGQGIILADDGDIVDLNDGFCAMRFSSGVRIHSANRGGSAVIRLGNGGNIIANDNITAYGSASDRRLKENVKPLVGALDKVMQLQGCTFDWRENTDQRDLIGIKEDIGFIADEVQAVVPEMVRTDVEGYLSLRDRGFSAILVEAMKEQQKQIEDQKTEISELKSMINMLVDKVNKLVD